MSQSRFEPLPMESKTETVSRYLRGKIRSGEIQPGQRLLLDILAQELGVSPTPVREALRRLQAEGLVTYEPYKGVTVRGVTEHELKHVSHLRVMVEGYAARLAAKNITPEQLGLLVSIHAEMESLYRTGDVEIFSVASEEWHLAIYQATHVSVIPELVGRLWAFFPGDTLGTIPHRPAATLIEHEDILRALQQHDEGAAEQAMARHIRSAENFVVQFRQARPERTERLSD